jgi:hypothetical protein
VPISDDCPGRSIAFDLKIPNVAFEEPVPFFWIRHSGGGETGVQELQELRSQEFRSSGVAGASSRGKKLPDSSKRIKLYAVQDGKKKEPPPWARSVFFHSATPELLTF